MCQCPKRANFISTDKVVLHIEYEDECVNALNGLISFLLRFAKSRIKSLDGCVNALNGLISFLQNTGSTSSGYSPQVSMP